MAVTVSTAPGLAAAAVAALAATVAAFGGSYKPPAACPSCPTCPAQPQPESPTQPQPESPTTEDVSPKDCLAWGLGDADGVGVYDSDFEFWHRDECALDRSKHPGKMPCGCCVHGHETAETLDPAVARAIGQGFSYCKGTNDCSAFTDDQTDGENHNRLNGVYYDYCDEDPTSPFPSCTCCQHAVHLTFGNFRGETEGHACMPWTTGDATAKGWRPTEYLNCDEFEAHALDGVPDPLTWWLEKAYTMPDGDVDYDTCLPETVGDKYAIDRVTDRPHCGCCHNKVLWSAYDYEYGFCKPPQCWNARDPESRDGVNDTGVDGCKLKSNDFDYDYIDCLCCDHGYFELDDDNFAFHPDGPFGHIQDENAQHQVLSDYDYACVPADFTASGPGLLGIRSLVDINKSPTGRQVERENP